MRMRLSTRAFDAALAAVVLVTSVVEMLLSNAITGPRWAAVLFAAGMSALLLVRRRAIDSSGTENVLFPGVIVTLCWLGGRNVRTRTRLAVELHEGAERLAEQREVEAREAVAEERRRIAREMHDVVAHGIA